jgi:hypothetical protein
MENTAENTAEDAVGNDEAMDSAADNLLMGALDYPDEGEPVDVIGAALSAPVSEDSEKTLDPAPESATNDDSTEQPDAGDQDAYAKAVNALGRVGLKSAALEVRNLRDGS